MKQVLWTPTFDDGEIRHREFDRPTDTDEPTTWEVPLFHGGAPVGDIAALFGVMAGCPRHTFRVLVQDVASMADWFSWVEGFEHVDPVSVCEIEAANRTDVDQLAPSWPLPNVTLVFGPFRTQTEADAAAPALLDTKAARREAVFAPTEAIYLGRWLGDRFCMRCTRVMFSNEMSDPGDVSEWVDPECSGACPDCGGETDSRYPDEIVDLQAVRVRGGETPMHPAWVRALRDQATEADVPFSLVWGEWTVRRPGMSDDEPRVRLSERGKDAQKLENVDGGEEVWMQRVGAARSGCSLDDTDYPEVL